MKIRVLSGIVIICVLLPLVFINYTLPITLVGLLATAIAGFEYSRLVKGNKCSTILISLLGYYSIVAYKYTPALSDIITPLYLVLITFLATSIYIVLKDRDLRELFHSLIALIYIGFGVGSIVTLKFFDTRILIYLAIVIAMTDTFAYFFGVKFGKHKLAPTISPKKSIEGSVAGSVFGTILGVSYLYFSGLLNDFTLVIENIYVAIMLTIIISIVGQLGDLFASKIKRTYSVKDFGKLFPGHGGILDRFDSFLFGAMVLYILFS